MCTGFKPLALFMMGALLVSAQASLGATFVHSFDTPDYGQPDLNCVNSPRPPLFNRPEYGNQTAAYVADPAGCGEGAFGTSNGSDSLLTASFRSTPPSSNELRWSWEDPTNDDSWVRVISFSAQQVTPHFEAPTIDITPGSSISMDVTIFGFDAGGNESAGGQLEFSLVVRETGRNLPLGVNGGVTGPLEFVGVDCVGPAPGCTGGSTTDLLTPSGGVVLAHDPFSNFVTIKWTFVDDGGNTVVDVSVNGGPPVRKGIAAFTGDGILSAASNRATLDSLAIRKAPGDDVTKQWFVNVDNIVIDAPGIADPVLIEPPVTALHTFVTISNIDPAAEEVRLYTNGANPISATAPPEDFSDGTYTFTGLSLTAGDVLTATQVVGGVESAHSDAVTVGDKICLEDFTGGVPGAGPSVNPPASGGVPGTWYQTVVDGFVTTLAGTLDGSPAMRINDGGFKNGVYAIFENVIPADGNYAVSAKIHVSEGADATNVILQYQMGVIVNGQHRVTSGCCTFPCDSFCCHQQSLLAVDTTLPGNAVGNYVGLSPANDSGLPTQLVTTGEFTANAGDSLLIVFATNVETKWADVMLGNQTPQQRLDEQDSCETPVGFPPPPPNYVRNGQGTWNIRADRSNTSGNWGGGFIRIDEICLVKPNVCATIPPVAVATPIVNGQTQVTVISVDPAATLVTVYADGSELITVPATSPETVVNLPGSLTAGQVISATQTVDGQEGCVPEIGVTVGDCSQIGSVSVVGPVNAGSMSVTVQGVTEGATAIKVYDIGTSTVVGTLTTGIVAGTNTVPLTSEPVKSQRLAATQTLPATQASAGVLEGCVPTAGVMVGTGNAPIRLALGLREIPGLTGPVGADGGIGTAPDNTIEFVIPDDPNDPDDGKEVDGIPRGIKIFPSPEWQTVTFDPTSDVISGFTGDGVLTGTWGVLEHLAIVIDEAAPDVGPYTLFIDDIQSSDGTNPVQLTGFEGFPVGQQVVFQAPSFSGSSTVAAPPNRSVVTDVRAVEGTQSLVVEWRFPDEGANRWVRLVTFNTPNLPNPQVNLTRPITMRVLLLPALQCNTPAVDFDGDTDVDLVDFGFFQRCFDPLGTPSGCGCADVNNDGRVDLSDFGDPLNPQPPTFVGCAQDSRDGVKSPCAP